MSLKTLHPLLRFYVATVLERALNHHHLSRHYNEKPLKIKSVNLTENGRLIELKTPDLQPTWCMEILYNLKTTNGVSISNRIHNTIHNLARN